MKIAFIGTGYGGSCFTKDTEALYHFASTRGYDFKLLKGVISTNKRQRELMVEKIKHLLGDLKDKAIGVFGLAFKQDTDDIRKSPSIDIIQLLLKEGEQIRCFDQNVPEETNRKIVDCISDISLPYTDHSRRYLLSEGIKAVDIEKYSSFHEKNTAEINSGNQLRIAYFVGLHLNRWESLAKVGEAIKELSKKI